MKKLITRNIRPYVRRLALGITALIAVTVLVQPAAAQSTDPDNPTPMTADTVKARWPKGNRISHYYSFVGGPGVVKVSFNATPEGNVDAVGGQLTDADGHASIPF